MDMKIRGNDDDGWRISINRDKVFLGTAFGRTKEEMYENAIDMLLCEIKTLKSDITHYKEQLRRIFDEKY